MDWTPPSDWVKIRTIEAHAPGEPLRVIVEGWPQIPGDTMLARFATFSKERIDAIEKTITE